MTHDAVVWSGAVLINTHSNAASFLCRVILAPRDLLDGVKAVPPFAEVGKLLYCDSPSIPPLIAQITKTFSSGVAPYIRQPFMLPCFKTD